jgi:hypothetical protein
MTLHLGSSRRTRVTSLLGALVLSLSVAACAVGGEESSSGDADVASPEPALADEGGGTAGSARGEDAAGEAPGDAASGRTAASSVAAMSRAVVSTGSVSLHSDDVARDRASVLRVVAGAGGVVADEQSTGDDDGGLSWSSLTLRVPSARFDDTMTRLAGLGTVVEQSRSAEDVTTQVIDNDARVRAQERSVRRIEALLTEAERLGDVIAIESDLARRQADLDSLKSQQAYLADQTSLSTITVSLDQPPKRATPDEEPDGFLAGLTAGWGALGTSTVVLLTSVGAVLPFTVALAVVGVPLWWLLRRRRRTTLVESGAAPAPGAA